MTENNYRPARTVGAILASVALALGGVLVAPLAANAATLTVLNTNDSGAGSLRDAIATAAAGDTIVFDGSLSSSTIQIATPLVVTKTLTISGLGSGTLSIATTVSSDYFRFEPTAVNQDFTLTGITVQGNSIQQGHGVVSVDTDSTEPARNITIVDVNLYDLYTPAAGGAAMLVDTISGTLRVENSEFVGNTSGGPGGAIVATDVAAQVSVTQSEFIGNEASGDGGAIVIDSPTASVTMTGAEFDNNEAQGSGAGGGVAIEEAGAVIVSLSNFESNISYNAGGGMAVFGAASLGVTNSLFFDNTVTSNRGGGLYVGGILGVATIEGTTFSFNHSNLDGGAFATLGGPDVTIRDSGFYDNDAAGNGGAISTGGSADVYSIERSTFDTNISGLNGGGVYINAVDSGDTFTVHSSTFVNNEADDFGSSLAIATIDGVATVINSTLEEPAASAGFALVSTVFEGELRIRYSTIRGGVLIEDNENVVEVVSSIVDGTTNPAVSVIFGGDPVDVSYSLLSSALTAQITDGGNNQFSVADFKLGPLQDNGGPTFTRLPLAGSPAIDRGFPGGTPPTFDQRYTGFPRVLGGRIDIGAVESSVLAATGQTMNIAVPIIGGVLLLGGVAAIVVSALRRRRLS